MRVNAQLEKEILTILARYAAGNELIVPESDLAAPCGYRYKDISAGLNESGQAAIDVLGLLLERRPQTTTAAQVGHD